MTPDQGFIVVVACNNLALTQVAAKSAVAQDHPSTLLLIDNASTDSTRTWTFSRPYLTLVNERRHALAACWNLALKTAWTYGYQHALVCNNDIELRPDTYRRLLAHGGPFVTAVSVRTREELNGLVADEPLESPHPDFSCFLIRKEVTDRVGWFDESYYPAYAEDSKFHVLMHRAGIQAVSIAVPFLHHGSSTLAAVSATERKAIEQGADRNREKFRQEFGCLPGTKEYYELFT
jgi:GT2 family glycosyltransferase